MGLRTRHFDYLLRQPTANVGWFEAITENFISTQGAPLYVLEQIRARYPVALHGVALSIGSYEGLNPKHLQRIRELALRIAPFQISDHLCFSRFRRRQYHELLPLPRTEAMLRRVIANIDHAQTYLKRQLVLENISAYREHPANEIPEPEFLNTLAEKSGCRLLLDINNIYVNAANFRFNARRFVREINPAYVVQYHLAGFTDMHTHLFDTHAEKVHAPVVRLFREARYHLGEKRFSLERDDRIPGFESLLRETQRLASATPVSMPSRFNSPLAMPSKSQRNVIATEPQPIAEWQRTFYTLPASVAETHCGTLSPRAAQKVYRDAYQIRLTSALADKFPLLFKTLGERKAKRIQKEFIDENISTHEDLALYGNNLPRWLKTRYESKREWQKLAELDMIQFEIFHAMLREGVSGLLQKKVFLAPTTRIWSASPSYVAVRAGRVVLLPAAQPGMQRLLCYRDAFAVKAVPLSAGQHRFVRHLMKPVRLGAVLARAERENWLPPQEVKKLFQVLGVAGVLACRQTTS
ncbi:DUF692 family multinuclear iron-containing protein [Turneriella parva]|uniref:multinuclear nonheme iron-dependent oxidase n=1 Tax=Turneriella parva TaxID=29510 RepID=UPI0024784F80|nr:DUF692 family multinuclear iron-containing protein [Turneriella parva]